MQIHIRRGDHDFGPYTLPEVKAYLADGSVLPTDLAWHEGMTTWVPITQLPGVTDNRSNTPPHNSRPIPEPPKLLFGYDRKIVIVAGVAIILVLSSISQSLEKTKKEDSEAAQSENSQPTPKYEVIPQGDLDFAGTRRIGYHIRIDTQLDRSQLEAIAKDIVKKANELERIDAITINYYLKGTGHHSGYTGGQVNWAPDGDWGKSKY